MQEPGGPSQRDTSADRAMVYFQSAMRVDPRNYAAANELGVLFARHGQLQDACKVLQHAARTAPRPEIWRNLAIVHQRLGEPAAAELAWAEYQRMAPVPTTGGAAEADAASRIVWVTPEQFSQGEVAQRERVAVESPGRSDAGPWARPPAPSQPSSDL